VPPTAPSLHSRPDTPTPAATRPDAPTPAPTRGGRRRPQGRARNIESCGREGAAAGVLRHGVDDGRGSTAARNSRRRERIGRHRDSDRASGADVRGGAVDCRITIIPLVR
jgi:hypothetical protein